MATIDVITFITNKCSDYAELLYKSCEKFKSGNHSINYLAVETNGGSDEWPEMWKKIAMTEDYGHGSMNHAIAVHKAIELSESVITVIVDCDICFLYKNWDGIITKELDSNDIFGGGYSDYRTAKFYNFPSPHLICFGNLPDTLDFMPLPKDGNVERIDIKTASQCALYGKSIGEQVKCDTGWKNVEICKKAGIKSFTMPMIYNFQNNILPYEDKSQKRIVQNFPMQQSEWHYNNKLYATHKQKATLSGHGLNGSGNIWKERIDMYTQKEYGFIL